MAIEYALDRSGSRLRITVSGPTVKKDFLDIMERQATDGAWAFRTLYDVRASEWIPTTAEIDGFLARVATLSHTHGPRGPIAVVTTAPALFGMSRMYAIRGESVGLQVGVFHTIEEAETWLATSE